MGKAKAKKVDVKDIISMQVVNVYSAGIDIGDKEIVVAVPEELFKPRVRTFGSMTCDLEEIAAHLRSCEIDSVVMESTGVYWKPLFALLNEGFKMTLVNARHVKNVTGRKDDENDAMWLQKLHSVGLLKSCYLPEALQEELRTMTRHRRTYVQSASNHVNRIQKSLELMNVKFHTVIADIMGKTGKAVVEAIIAGERNAANFLPLIDKGIKADMTTIEKSLQGNWSATHLFTLKQSYEMYTVYWDKIAECDRETEKILQEYAAMRNEGVIETQPIDVIDATVGNAKNQPCDVAVIEVQVATDQEVTNVKPTDAKEKLANTGAVVKKKQIKNSPRIDVQGYLKEIFGVDIMAIYGINSTGALEILAEVGTDMTKWKNEKHFVSWLNLCPNNKISGGKLISSKVPHKDPNAATIAFRAAANAVQRSENYLGDYFRRMKIRGGNKYAITATANKMATILYKMVLNKEEFRPVELVAYQEKYTDAKIAQAEKYLNKLKEKKQKLAA